MSGRRKLTLGEFFDSIAARLGPEAGRPRRRIAGRDGLLVWREGALKAGVMVSTAQGGAFVFLGEARAQIDAAAAAADLLKGVFSGELVEVRAAGPDAQEAWLAHASAPAQRMNRYNPPTLKTTLDVPVYTRMTLRRWPGC